MTYVGDRLLQLQRDYARKLLTHYNPYTKSEYRNEPAVACVEIVNENSLVEFWCRNWLQGKLTQDHPAPQLDFSPYYEKIISQMYQDWLAKNRTPEQLAQLRKLAGVKPDAPIPRTKRQDFRDCPAELFHTALRAINTDLERRGPMFNELSAEAQDAYLKSLESGGHDLDGVPSAVFFDMLLRMTVEGFFSDPVYGGNRDMVAWRMIGFPGAYADYYEAIDKHGVKFEREPLSIGEDGHGHVHVHPEIPASIG